MLFCPLPVNRWVLMLKNYLLLLSVNNNITIYLNNLVWRETRMRDKKIKIWASLAFIIAGASLADTAPLQFESRYEDDLFTDKCTSLMVGKEATDDGSVLCTQSQDSGNCGVRLSYQPSASYTPGAKRTVRLWNIYDRLDIKGNPAVNSGPSFEISQVERTFSYIATVFPFMNENQVAIGESTLGGIRRELAPSKNSDAKLKETDVSRELRWRERRRQERQSR